MQSQAHRILLLLPLLVAGCSTQVEVSTETRSPSPTTEHVQKSHTKVGVAVLADREDLEPSSVPEEPPTPPEAREKGVEVSGVANFAIVVEEQPLVSQGSQGRVVVIDGDGNFATIVGGDLYLDRRHGSSDDRPQAAAKKPRWNTKIPWPTQLSGASGWTLNCYLAVWALVIGSVALMVHTANRRKEGGPLWIILAMLTAAAILLQFLPYTASGIQIIPLSPWSYAGWESFFVSLACWAATLGAGYVVFDRAPDSPKAFSVLCLVGMFLNVLLSWSDLKEDLALRPQAAALSAS